MRLKAAQPSRNGDRRSKAQFFSGCLVCNVGSSSNINYLMHQWDLPNAFEYFGGIEKGERA
jgi:hypothetical protein